MGHHSTMTQNLHNHIIRPANPCSRARGVARTSYWPSKPKTRVRIPAGPLSNHPALARHGSIRRGLNLVSVKIWNEKGFESGPIPSH